MSATLATIILTYNEEAHLARALLSAKAVSTQIVVVNSYSTDRTMEIAAAAGAHAVQHEFVHQAQQFQWALDNLAIEAEWVMRLDADETLTPELIAEIKQELPRLPQETTGVSLKRRHIFLDRWIRHGGRYPLILLRIWRKGAARIEQRWMDEHIVLLQGRAVVFEHDFCDHNLNDLSFFTQKHNKYATREAIERLNEDFGLFPSEDAVSRGASSAQARLKRLIKSKFYNRLPFGVGPLSYFLWRYFAQLGFLDGREGLIYHFLQGFWYRFLVEARVFELRRALAPLRDRDEIEAEILKMTGLSITACDRQAIRRRA